MRTYGWRSRSALASMASRSPKCCNGLCWSGWRERGGTVDGTGLPAPRHKATGKGGGLGSGVPATIENLSLAGTSPSRVTGRGGVLLRIRRPTTI